MDTEKTAKTEQEVKISVRNLVEFILRCGDLESGSGTGSSVESMQLGARLHRKLQRMGGPSYQAEVWLGHAVLLQKEERTLAVRVEGRADGIFVRDGLSCIEEIKGVYRELYTMERPDPVHLAQAKCYAYLYGLQKEESRIGIRMTYCHMPTEDVRYFEEEYDWAELEQWFLELVREYGKWAFWQMEWKETRDASLKQISFPFAYRPGQKDLAAGVYRTILREKRLFLQAPTGVGKTISTVFPAVKAMGEGLAEKLFYLTAKTSTRTVAEDTLGILCQGGARLKSVTLTAKEKICIQEKPECSPVTCPRAKGHYDRVNEAVYDLLTHEQSMSRELIESYAKKHQVCPFEMCLDAAVFADVIIGDYNYVFDPVVCLKRFFQNEKKQNYVLLVDEAHNLVDRAREMYSEELLKEEFLEVKKQVKSKSKKMERALELCNKDMLALKRECDEFEEIGSVGNLILHLLNFLTVCEEFLREHPEAGESDQLMELFFRVRHFCDIYEYMDENYTIYTDYTQEGQFHLKLQCMDPSHNLKHVLDKVRSSIFFSATLLPVQYYREQLGGEEEDYAIYAPSPFEKENCLVMGAADVTTRYSRRGPVLYEKILSYIRQFTEARIGNYMVFFPSYQMLSEVAALAETAGFDLVLQHNHMREEEREAFLAEFREAPVRTKVGFCVMGGIFGEGIDLTEDRLIGAVIVGPGLPMFCNERELFRRYFERKGKDGFDYAYLYQGMNKVLQSGGRVIRTVKDRGAILLLDDRFFTDRYGYLFPREWLPIKRVSQSSLSRELEAFWNKGQRETEK